MIPLPIAPTTVALAPRPTRAVGLPDLQGTVLAVLWDATQPLTAAEVTARLSRASGAGVRQALGRLRTVGLVTATRHGDAHQYQAALGRDSYLAALIAAALDQASDPPAVLRTALHTPPAG